MRKKTKSPAGTPGQKFQVLIGQVTRFVENNKNIVYIAIIGFCLSITILYRLGRYFGWWT